MRASGQGLFCLAFIHLCLPLRVLAAGRFPTPIQRPPPTVPSGLSLQQPPPSIVATSMSQPPPLMPPLSSQNSFSQVSRQWWRGWRRPKQPKQQQPSATTKTNSNQKYPTATNDSNQQYPTNKQKSTVFWQPRASTINQQHLTTTECNNNNQQHLTTNKCNNSNQHCWFDINQDQQPPKAQPLKTYKKNLPKSADRADWG